MLENVCCCPWVPIVGLPLLLCTGLATVDGGAVTYPTPKEGLFSGLDALAAGALLLYCAGKGNPPFVEPLPPLLVLEEEVPGVGKD